MLLFLNVFADERYGRVTVPSQLLETFENLYGTIYDFSLNPPMKFNVQLPSGLAKSGI